MSRWARVRTWLRRDKPAVRRAGRPSVPLVPMTDIGRRVCRNCVHFRNDPATIEAAMPGLMALSSGDASVRGDDGLCFKHDRFVTTGSHCRFFHARLVGDDLVRSSRPDRE